MICILLDMLAVKILFWFPTDTRGMYGAKVHLEALHIHTPPRSSKQLD